MKTAKSEQRLILFQLSNSCNFFNIYCIRNHPFCIHIASAYEIHEIMHNLMYSGSIRWCGLIRTLRFQCCFIGKSGWLRKIRIRTYYFDFRICFVGSCDKIFERQRYFYQNMRQNQCISDGMRFACHSGRCKRLALRHYKYNGFSAGERLDTMNIVVLVRYRR